jgi:hypothetical protein
MHSYCILRSGRSFGHVLCHTKTEATKVFNALPCAELDTITLIQGAFRTNANGSLVHHGRIFDLDQRVGWAED